MKHVIYKRPSVSDKHYDDYNWERHKGPYDDKSEARDVMPSVGSPLAEGYNYTVIPFEDDEEIKNSVKESEKQSRQRKLR